jgi:hypothetical protein
MQTRAEWTHYAAFDIVLDMTFSSPAGFLRLGIDVDGLLASLQALFNVAQVAGIYTVIMRILHLSWVNPLLAPQPTDKSGPGVLQGVSREVSPSIALPNMTIHSLHGKQSKNDMATTLKVRSATFYNQ